MEKEEELEEEQEESIRGGAKTGRGGGGGKGGLIKGGNRQSLSGQRVKGRAMVGCSGGMRGRKDGPGPVMVIDTLCPAVHILGT